MMLTAKRFFPMLGKLHVLALRGHYYCEDSWYSCPKAQDGCADESVGKDCTCGAESHNANVEAIYSKLKGGYYNGV